MSNCPSQKRRPTTQLEGWCGSSGVGWKKKALILDRRRRSKRAKQLVSTCEQASQTRVKGEEGFYGSCVVVGGSALLLVVRWTRLISPPECVPGAT